MRPSPITDLLRRPILWAASFAIASLAIACGAGSSSGPGASDPGRRSGKIDPEVAAAFARPGITGGDYPTDYIPCSKKTMAACAEYESAASALIEDVRAMRFVNDANDIGPALSMLALPDARVQAELLKLLALHADDKRVEAVLLTYLVDPHTGLQQIAAEGLAHGSDDAQRLAEMWKAGHRGYEVDPRDRDPARDPSWWGFPGYAGAAPYPPADSFITMGLTTSDPVEKVAAALGRDLKQKPVELAMLQGAVQLMMADLTTAAQAEATDRHDDLPFKRLSLVSPLAAPLPRPEIARDGKFFVLNDDHGQPTRAALVYREPALGVTVIEYLWNARAHRALPRVTQPLELGHFVPG
ncbi:MAG: hypothetical protein U0359_26270 [Byssovorax sp.]